MPLARWKDLCVDTTDMSATAEFWAAAMDLRFEPRSDAVTLLRGDRPECAIWVNLVPEPKSVKNRVHPDLRHDLERLLVIGATVLRAPDDEISWHVLADPAGNEFCCFPRRADHPEGGGFYELVVGAADPVAQATWWAKALGGQVREADGVPWRWVEGAPGTPFQYLVFTPVPEPKTVKNRWHWDVACDDLDGLLATGATLLRRPDDDIDWHVLADPEGNEFCVFGSG
jgi:Glyoxalase-like domain